MAKRKEPMTLMLRNKGLNIGTLLDALPDSPEPEDRAGEDCCNTYTAADETEPQSLLPRMQPQNIPATTFQGSSTTTTDHDVSSRGSSRHMNQDSPESVAVSDTVSHNGADFQRCDADASESTNHTNDIVPEDVIDPARTPAPPSHNQSSVVPVMDKLLTSSGEGCSSSDTDAAESTRHTSDIVSEDVIDLAKHPAPPSHNQSSVESVVPVMDKLLMSADKGHSSSGTTSSSEHGVTDRDLVDRGKPKDTDSGKHNVALSEANVRRTFSQVQHSLQGFLFGPPEKLQDCLMKIVTGPRDFGIYVWDQLRPSEVNGVMRYRPNLEFHTDKVIHKSKNSSCSVYLCHDIHTKKKFVCKKIMKDHHRLIGIEFLVLHSQDFLPKIYGVYKEEHFIYIFEEFVTGGTLSKCSWNIAGVRQLTEVLLSAFRYLHCHNLAHSDVKLSNLMVRNTSDPTSLVVIDFESAKHPQYPFQNGGHTVNYLPPWYERILNLKSYDPLLKAADLWAIACVIISFLVPSDTHGQDVWSKEMMDIKQRCATCQKVPGINLCGHCKKIFLHFVKQNGHRILHFHLGQLMESEIDDPNLKVLRNVLEYLTDPDNIHKKHVDIALSIVQGNFVYQRAPRALQC